MLADWRNDLRTGLRDRGELEQLAEYVANGSQTLIPWFPEEPPTEADDSSGPETALEHDVDSPEPSPTAEADEEPALPAAKAGDRAAARLLAAQESDRLANARLYFADQDTTSLSIAVGATPPSELASIDRLPSPYGLMVFSSPIGDDLYFRDAVPGIGVDPDLEFHVPIVAVSWGLWSPASWTYEDAVPTWWGKTPDGRAEVPHDAEGVWMSFYTSPGLGLEAVHPDTPITVDPRTGRVVRAGQRLAATRPAGPLTAYDEIFKPFGTPFAQAESASVYQWMHVVYTAWQLMQDNGRRGWTEAETIERSSAGRKRDRRAELPPEPDLTAVNVVRLQERHRPSPTDTARDLDASDPTRAARCEFRWPVAPYRRPNACFNPRIHTDDPDTRPCRHGEQIVKGHVNGPKGKPIRTSGPVHLWTLPPSPAPDAATPTDP